MKKRSQLRAAQSGLAVAAVGSTALLIGQPTGGTVSTTVSLTISFVVPGLLALSALLTPVTEGTNVGPLLIAALGGATLLVVAWASTGLFAAESGVFLGAVFAVFASTVLAVVVLVRNVVLRLRGRRGVETGGELA